MSELRPERDPIVIAIGGTGASEKVVEDYYSHLVGVSAPDVDSGDKLFALENGGLQPLQGTYDELKDRVQRFRRQHIGRKVIILGHSQGGVHAARLGVDRQGEAIVTLAAPIRGGVTEGLPSLGDPEIAHMLEDELSPKSAFMTDLNHDIETRWPGGVPLHVISAGKGDMIVPQASQYGVNLPGAYAPREFVVASPVTEWLGGDMTARRLVGAPEHAEVIAHRHPVGHFLIPRADGLPGHLRALVDELHPDAHYRRVA